MTEYDSRSRDRLQKPGPHCNSEGTIQYLLIAEKQILHSISTRAPLPQILNNVCSALDCQVGNVVSLISLQDDDASDLASIARDAKIFGLHIFHSARVVAENGEALGSLEMYCCFRRSPSRREIQWIERAMCLAAIAIHRNNERNKEVHEGADHHNTCCFPENRPVRGRVLEWPVSVN